MNTYFVYYCDGDPYEPCVGYKYFNEKSEVEAFIQGRAEGTDDINLHNYVVMYGRPVDLEVVRFVREIKIKE